MVTIDAGAYPHILCAIVAAAPPAALLTLRATSKSLREAVDTRLASHVLLWADGRVSSRLLPSGRLPFRLADLADHIHILDIQMFVPRRPGDSGLRVLQDRFLWARCDANTRCNCGWSRLAQPRFPPMPHLRAVRRWGPHTCWAPAVPRLTHFEASHHADTWHVPDDVAWYILPTWAVSRFNRVDVDARPRYVLAGTRTRGLFGMVDEWNVKRAVDRADKEDEERSATRADYFAALLAMVWLHDEDKDGKWTLVDVESWPEWEGATGVADTIRQRITRCCVAAHLYKGKKAGIEDKLRFISSEEYEEEMGELAALEEDDHEWKF
ncbi:hypothetical protein CC85DRAFT_300385 [Cutaneotrichosporon oleaginosum]|uniref:F-box domain-containing protein n=1 Tax=Cutaneotrichosporon oleaginosum TaxID=879819 RepID=A0A0J0XU10_9TREE|nr:uncharacterized protein CC85DRAFT_300385 [Cutaneotrichosporon oleaginosum]KLT44537.1 hypothetical protein CC85DRAFT_300385 [Cutaneotrichosporon oleaginosum]TXT13949.1 hypothetical protein COLE_00142 [Cutaneotrichosporon oleaginosum]